MNSTSIISIIALVVVFSLIASGVSYSRQQAMKKRKLRISKLKQQSDELLGCTSLLLKIDEEYKLVSEIQSLSVTALKAAHQLAPDDQFILTNLRTQEGKFLNYKSGQRDNKVTCYVTSDIELNQALSQLSQVSRLLDIYRNKGSLTAAKCQELQTHLQQLKVELNINSNLYQADSFAESGDMTMYQMHIKQALDILKKSNIEGEAKNSRIRELSALLAEAKRTNRVVGEGNFIKPDSKVKITQDQTKDLKKPTNENKEKW